MIKVVFKGQKSLEFDDQEFTYKGYENAEVGDIVVANTRYGYAIAKVVVVEVVDIDNEDKYNATIETVIKSMAEQRKETERKEIQKALAKKVRRMQILHSLERLDFDKEDMNIIEDMTDDELKLFYDTLMK